jgi:hypothetical protein
MSKNEQSPELTPSSREALLELLCDVLKAQETKPDELKAKQQRLVDLLRRDAGKKN